ncbi:uncharacterized protein FA14DRAFT_152356 [Meira miltonrushii]|uniref:Uncharacterized protein n=1 Tax=Meira miltonrushii TaxID=1280837 RepID=A0A316VHB5_9BASI|nr:uncharacterized protein FA14DRAFT_152356 [Meira miltonrushii]PWN36936.1 hypothetical protein FA14DRAFT_152356 [Meira miltonrushii]
MRFAIILLSFLAVFANLFVNATPIKGVSDSLEERNYSPDAPIGLLKRQGSTLHALYAQFCDKDGDNCSTEHDMFSRQCFYEDVSKGDKIRIKSYPRQQSGTFVLHSYSTFLACDAYDDGTFFGNKQEIVKPYDGEVIDLELQECAPMQNTRNVGQSDNAYTKGEKLLERDNYIYAQLCNEAGLDCTGQHYLTNPACFDWNSTTKALRIHASPAIQSSSFTLYTTSVGQTCPDQITADQYLYKPFDGQLIPVTSTGTRFYFEGSA